ncbi:MAG: ATP-binding protein [Terrimicrobiaceae bacterium]|nr:ATP-binding protein [Terrimicrobiaceae bacterium]
MPRLALPSRVTGIHLVSLFAHAQESDDRSPIEIDFSHLEHVTPVFLAAVPATIERWKAGGRPVVLSGLEACKITSYLQRMDFLDRCGVHRAEDFQRRSASGRFVPVRPVEQPVEELAKEVAACFAPGGEDFEHANAGFFDFLVYAVTEMGNNILQHSCGRGFAAVQSSRADGMVRLALADNGCGILKSFQRVELPWSMGMSHEAAILKAMEPRVSCKSGEPNEGVGLTILAHVVSQMKGWLMVASGSGMVQVTPRCEKEAMALPEGGSYEGTLVALTVRRSSAAQFGEYLHNAKIDKGLLPVAQRHATFWT